MRTVATKIPNMPISRVSRKRPRVILPRANLATMVATVILALLPCASSFSMAPPLHHSCRSSTREMTQHYLGEDDDWGETEETDEWVGAVWGESTEWSEFASSEEEGVVIKDETEDDYEDVDETEAFLDILQSIQADELEFNMKDNERANKAQQMAEWGFDDEIIKNTFGFAMDDAAETVDEPAGLQAYREEMWQKEEDAYDTFDDIESHTRVERDPDTNEPIRQQMVYVDEHACIGCTNCATIADSTFFMESWHGRARVFNQWGDTEDTIAMAIETCPVDCIHYVPYEELEKLEIERRDQNINNAARLVNQGESSHMAGVGGNGFSQPQVISSNQGSRCNNCPSKGCKNCPMFGVGKNPEYEKRELARKTRAQRKKLERERLETSKSVEL